jgi:hypothetical protein
MLALSAPASLLVGVALGLPVVLLESVPEPEAVAAAAPLIPPWPATLTTVVLTTLAAAAL